MRFLIRLLALAAAGTVTALTASPALASAPARSPFCVPEAPVCAGIAGEPGNYYYTYRFQPPPTGYLTFMVNGVYTYGHFSQRTGPDSMQGQFWPSTHLVSGDELCMTYTQSGESGRTCDTVP